MLFTKVVEKNRTLMYLLFKLVTNGDKVVLDKLDEAVIVDADNPDDIRQVYRQFFPNWGGIFLRFQVITSRTNVHHPLVMGCNILTPTGGHLVKYHPTDNQPFYCTTFV